MKLDPMKVYRECQHLETELRHEKDENGLTWYRCMFCDLVFSVREMIDDETLTH